MNQTKQCNEPGIAGIVNTAHHVQLASAGRVDACGPCRWFASPPRPSVGALVGPHPVGCDTGLLHIGAAAKGRAVMMGHDQW